MKWLEKRFQRILAPAGVTIGGDTPWDIRVLDKRLYRKVLLTGSLGLGEAYMDGWWTAQDLSDFFTHAIVAGLDRKVGRAHILLGIAQAVFRNLQSRSRAFVVGERHYDIGNDLYEKMLDARMVYTCGYWENARTLDEAQEAKLDLVCRKIGLKPGSRVLDVGCGWGSFAQFAAERYGAEVVGVTVSKEQAALARERTKGLPVTIEVCDYRDITGTFDAIVSLGMFEHVGYKNYRVYMETMNAALEEDGLFLLHTIGGNRSVYTTDPWIEKYIFPGGMIPSIRQVGDAIEDLFVMEDWHNFGPDYDATLMAWFSNFDRNWPLLKEKYGERFYRMWTYYLMVSAAVFRSRKNQLWQIVLSKRGVPGGCQSVR